MSSAPDQSPQGVIHDEADEDVTSGRHLRTDHDRRNNHRHKDRAGEDKAGTGEAAEPASLGERIVFRLKQWGITLSYLVVAVAIIALIRTFIIQSFTIPSGSMENTLNEGDRVTVTMYGSDKVHRPAGRRTGLPRRDPYLPPERRPPPHQAGHRDAR